MRMVNTVLVREVNIIDYIPLQLSAEELCPSADYYLIQKGDSSLLELIFSEEDHLIHRITLVICSNYSRLDEVYQMPHNYHVGDIYVDSSVESEVSTFTCYMYKNAIMIRVSDLPGFQTIRSGNVIWELSSQGDLISLCVTSMLPEAVMHCYDELRNAE